jgi:hypothetical protein
MNRFTHAAVAGLVVLGAASCSDGPVSSRSGLDRPQLSSQGGDLTKLAKYIDGRPKIMLGISAATIGPAGGRLKLQDFEVIVPAGAVSTPTRFTIRMPADPTGSEYVYAEFSPHGYTFGAPLTLILPYKGTTSEGSTVHVMWNDAGTWVPFETSLTADGRIQTKTNHFSEYGTEDGFSKGITLNGKPQR